jgi:Ca2+-binding RTX toxin-like protein
VTDVKVLKDAPNIVVYDNFASRHFLSTVIGNHDVAFLYEWASYDGSGNEVEHLQLNITSDTGTNMLSLDRPGYTPDITPLSGGRFLINWYKSEWYQYNPDGADFRRVLVDHFVYDSKGNNIIQVETSSSIYGSGYSFNSSDAVALTGGGWIETDRYSKSVLINGKYVMIQDEHLRFYGKDGSLLSSMNDISSNSTSFGLALSDGTFVRLSDENYDIGYSKYTANGATLVSDLRVNDSTAGNKVLGDAEALSNGGWVVAWASYENGYSMASIYQTIYSKDGTSIKDVRIMDNSYDGDIDVTVLADGGWVDTWISTGTVQNQVRQQVFNSNGTARTGVVRVDVDAPTPGSKTYYPQLKEVISISEGGFVVAWQDYYGTSGKIAVYDAAGKAIGKPIAIQGAISDLISLDDGSWTVIYKNGYDISQQDFHIDKTLISGSSKANSLNGTTGYDKIVAGAGNDTLHGLAGADDLYGGTGVDKLYGEAGIDTFFFAKGDTGKTRSTADTIFDFTSADSIDLSKWDANTKISGTQDFLFIGTAAFHGKAGELRYTKEKSDTWIEGDTNGDKKVDLVIHLDDALTLKAAYFDF